jgi:osmotically-inducible protein OsmY
MTLVASPAIERLARKRNAKEKAKMSIPLDNDLEMQTDDVDAAAIGVAVDAGTVELSGEVDDYTQKVAAEKAALRVRGVRAIVSKLAVRPQAGGPPTTAEIAREVDHALEWAINVPDTVKAQVNAHHDVTLYGDVDWDFQRNAARRAVQQLRGVYTVNDKMSLRARPAATETEQRIKQAIERNATLDANTIHVDVSGNTVTLTGSVGSWLEKQQAGRTAWSSPHVAAVRNDIVVRTR